jgi:hypothetical protein
MLIEYIERIDWCNERLEEREKIEVVLLLILVSKVNILIL